MKFVFSTFFLLAAAMVRTCVGAPMADQFPTNEQKQAMINQAYSQCLLNWWELTEAERAQRPWELWEQACYRGWLGFTPEETIWPEGPRIKQKPTSRETLKRKLGSRFYDVPWSADPGNNAVTEPPLFSSREGAKSLTKGGNADGSRSSLWSHGVQGLTSNLGRVATAFKTALKQSTPSSSSPFSPHAMPQPIRAPAMALLNT